MELRNRKRLRYDHSTYIPSIDDDDSFDNIGNNIYLAFGMYIFLIGIISFAVMACNMKYNTVNKPFTQPNVRHSMIQHDNTLTYFMKNSTQPIQTIQLIQPIQPIQPTQKTVSEIKTRIYSVFIQTSNHSSSYELYWNRHHVLKELIHNGNMNKTKNHVVDLIQPIIKKYNSNFNSCFIRVNEYSQGNILSLNTYNLISSNTFLSTHRPTEFIDITIVSGNKKINASQSVITVYDGCL